MRETQKSAEPSASQRDGTTVVPAGIQALHLPSRGAGCLRLRSSAVIGEQARQIESKRPRGSEAEPLLKREGEGARETPRNEVQIQSLSLGQNMLSMYIGTCTHLYPRNMSPSLSPRTYGYSCVHINNIYIVFIYTDYMERDTILCIYMCTDMQI